MSQKDCSASCSLHPVTAFVLSSSALTSFLRPTSSVSKRSRSITSRRSKIVSIPHKKNAIVHASLLSEVLVKSVEVAAATAVSRKLVARPNVGTTLSQNVKLNSETKNGVVQQSLEPQLSASINAIPTVTDAMAIIDSLAGSLQTVAGRRKWTKLAVCVLIDLIGSGGLGVPLVSDLLDVVTAPLAALALHALFGNPVITSAGFVEEILPGTDGIPTASLAWLLEHYGYLSSTTGSNSTIQLDE